MNQKNISTHNDVFCVSKKDRAPFETTPDLFPFKPLPFDVINN
jgi:hypothetical protein